MNMYKINYRKKAGHPEDSPFYSGERMAKSEEQARENFNKDKGEYCDIVNVELAEENINPSAIDKAFHS